MTTVIQEKNPIRAVGLFLSVVTFSLVAVANQAFAETSPLKYPCALGEWGEFYQQSLDTLKPTNTLFIAVENFEKEGRKPSLAVDLGVGTGRDTLYLLSKDCPVLAVDQEPEAIQIISSRVSPEQKNSLELQLSPFINMKLPDQVDLMTSNGLPFCKPDEFHQVWQNIVDHLAVGGRFAGHFFGDKDVYAIRALYPEMTTHTLEQVLELFKDRFEIEFLEVEEVMHPTLEGTSEELWHAIYVVAKKISS
jgi:tellurite methyltransferase